MKIERPIISIRQLFDAVGALHQIEHSDFAEIYEVTELKANLLHLIAGMCSEHSTGEMPYVDVGPEPRSRDEAESQLAQFVSIAVQRLNCVGDGVDSSQVPLVFLGLRATTFASLLKDK